MSEAGVPERVKPLGNDDIYVVAKVDMDLLEAALDTHYADERTREGPVTDAARLLSADDDRESDWACERREALRARLLAALRDRDVERERVREKHRETESLRSALALASKARDVAVAGDTRVRQELTEERRRVDALRADLDLAREARTEALSSLDDMRERRAGAPARALKAERDAALAIIDDMRAARGGERGAVPPLGKSADIRHDTARLARAVSGAPVGVVLPDDATRKPRTVYGEAAEIIERLSARLSESIPRGTPNGRDVLERAGARVQSYDPNDRTVDERDRAQEAADRLTASIARHLTMTDFGEHSNANDPWKNAFEALERAGNVGRLVAERDRERASSETARRAVVCEMERLNEARTTIARLVDAVGLHLGVTGLALAPAAIEALEQHAHPPTASEPVYPSAGVRLIHAERERQVGVKGWSLDHDDEHTRGELAWAAAAYAAAPDTVLRLYSATGSREAVLRDVWPWSKVHDRRPAPGCTLAERMRGLVKGGALLAAEIERLVRMMPADLARAGEPARPGLASPSASGAVGPSAPPHMFDVEGQVADHERRETGQGTGGHPWDVDGQVG